MAAVAGTQVFSIPFRYLWNTNFTGDLEIHGEQSAQLARFVGDAKNRTLRVFSDEYFQPFFQKTDHAIWPITLFGASGTGKTSLALSIISNVSDCQSQSQFSPRQTENCAKPIVLSAPDFDRRFRAAIETDSVTDFRRRMLVCRGLVIDDLHRLDNKVATQKEILQLIDQMYLRNRPFVLTLDRDPNQHAGLITQLRSRLCGGLCLPVNTPGPAARRVIIRDLCKIHHLQASLDAQELLVNRLAITVPRIVGFFGQLVSLLRSESDSQSQPRVINTDTINRLFGHTRDNLDRFSSSIIALVSKEFRFKSADIRGHSRKQSLVQARAIAIYLHRKLLGMTFLKIGQIFGNRDHSTVMHAHRKIEQLLNESSPKDSLDTTVFAIRNKVEKLEQELINQFAGKFSYA